MITRIRRIWHVAGAFGRRDPALFIAIFALWALLSGLSLLATTDTFARTPIYSVARDIGLSDNLVGAGMVANAVVLAWGLGDRPPRVRASISLLTGILWCFWSFILFAGGIQVGLYSAAAIWTFCAAICLMRSTAVHVLPGFDPADRL